MQIRNAKLKIFQPKRIDIFSYFSTEAYTLEAPQQDASNENKQYVFVKK